MVHHQGRPDLFKADAKKITDEQLKGYFWLMIARTGVCSGR